MSRSALTLTSLLLIGAACRGGEPSSSITRTALTIAEDGDQDGVRNTDDLCPNTPAGEKIDGTGCGLVTQDSDLDGIGNGRDLCTGTAANAQVDAAGCSAAQGGVLPALPPTLRDTTDLFERSGWTDPNGNGCGPGNGPTLPVDLDGDGTNDTLVAITRLTGQSYRLNTGTPTQPNFRFYMTPVFCSSNGRAELTIRFVDMRAPGFDAGNRSTWTFKTVPGVRLDHAPADFGTSFDVTASTPGVGAVPAAFKGFAQIFSHRMGIGEIRASTDYLENDLDNLRLLIQHPNTRFGNNVQVNPPRARVTVPVVSFPGNTFISTRPPGGIPAPPEPVCAPRTGGSSFVVDSSAVLFSGPEVCIRYEPFCAGPPTGFRAWTTVCGDDGCTSEWRLLTSTINLAAGTICATPGFNNFMVPPGPSPFVVTGTPDTTAPTLATPANITVRAPNAAGAVVNFTVTATDANDPDPTVSCNRASGSLFTVGTHVVACAASDASGNAVSGSFQIIVLPPIGGPCQSSAQCGGLDCVDGVCCDTACGGGDPTDCRACSVMAGAQTNGLCGPVSSGRVCRASAGACDLVETCDGAGIACPADLRRTNLFICRASAGACDLAETCTGGVDCPADVTRPAGTVCRASAGTCDLAETCTGTSPSCPPDQVQPPIVVCRASGGSCDTAETCDGATATCPADLRRPSGFPCRAGTPPCDPAETCDGVAVACPADQLAPPATVCRPSAGACDVSENCTGVSSLCPPDLRQAAGAVCRASAGVCDVSESCDGASTACPPDQVQPPIVVCRTSAGSCDVADTCDGATASCPADVREPAGTQCRAGTGLCDPGESCDGVAISCPADQLAPAGTVCRGGVGDCDLPETCTGGSAQCPADQLAPSGTVCRISAGLCDVAESCDGASAACPADAFVAADTVCRPIAGPCDLPDRCTGSAADCPDVVVGAGTVCNAGAQVCEPMKSCDGSSPACPEPASPPPPANCTYFVDFTGNRVLRYWLAGAQTEVQRTDICSDSAPNATTLAAASSPCNNTFNADELVDISPDPTVKLFSKLTVDSSMGTLKGTVVTAASTTNRTALDLAKGSNSGFGQQTINWGDQVTVTGPGPTVPMLLQVELDSTIVSSGAGVTSGPGPASVTANTMLCASGGCDVTNNLGMVQVSNTASAPNPMLTDTKTIQAPVNVPLTLKGQLYLQAESRLRTTSGDIVQVSANAANTARVRLIPLAAGVSYVTASGRGPYLPDTNPPAAAITAPAAGTRVRGAVPLVISASDDLSGVARVAAWAGTIALGSCSGSPCSLPLVGLPDGPVSVRVRAWDFEGNASAEETRSFIIDNNSGPVLVVPASVDATATSAAGAHVFFTATATDPSGASLPVTCSPASGILFPPGLTTTTCTTHDEAGNNASASFEVRVTFAWSGVLPPLHGDGSSVFGHDDIIPLRFKLTGPSAGILLRATLALVGPDGATLPIAAGRDQFRYEGGQGVYIFDLPARVLYPGPWLLRIDLGDGVVREVGVTVL